MCEFLVRAGNSFHPDPGKDKTGSYKDGDPIVCMSDGHFWGTEEDPATSSHKRFRIVKVIGLPASEGMEFCQEEVESTGFLEPDGTPMMRRVRRRKYRLDWAKFSSTEKNALSGRGIVSVNQEKIWNNMRNKKTGQTRKRPNRIII